MQLPKDLPKKEILSGRLVYRVWQESLDANKERLYEAVDFNPYYAVQIKGGELVTEAGKCAHLKKKTHRFSPTIDNNKTVPAIYAGSSEHCALSETLFRGHDGVKPIVLDDLTGKFIDEVIINEDIVLCDLSSPYLKGGALQQFDFTAQGSIESRESAKAYKRCHEIANAIYNHKDNVNGIYWESRQLPNTFNIVIWQRNKSFQPIGHCTPIRETDLMSKEGIQLVLLEATRQGVPASELLVL